MKITIELDITEDQARSIEFDVLRMTKRTFDDFRTPRPTKRGAPSLQVVAAWLKIKALSAAGAAQFEAEDYDRISKQYTAKETLRERARKATP